MSYFPGVYITQYHKSRGGYYINHDSLMNANPVNRNKLIFYYIAENVPQKLNESDYLEYQRDRNDRFGNSITMWTYATFFGILLPTSFAVIQRRRTTGIRDIAIWGGLAGYTATVVNSTMWRTHEARMIESSPVIEKLANKYNFGIYDFSLARKECHVSKLLDVYDAHRETIHDS